MKLTYRIATMVVLSFLTVAPLGARAYSPAEDGLDEERKARRLMEKSRLRFKYEMHARKLTQTLEETRRFECRIESYLDGTVMVSKPYDPEIEPVLVKFGHVEVMSPPAHRGRQLYEGRVYQVFPVAADVPQWKIEKLVGQQVELELETLVHSGRPRVIRIREPRGAGDRRMTR